MGMYDSIKFDVIIPGLDEVTTHVFQTKDFECGLDYYRVDNAGRLMIERRNIEVDSDEPSPIFEWENYLFDGAIEFYSFVDGIFVTYKAGFENGILKYAEITPNRTYGTL